MGYKSIVMHCNDPRRIGRLCEAAVPLARAMQGHLIGLSVMPPYLIIPAMDGAGVSVTVDQHRTAYADEQKVMKAAFLKAGSDLPRPAEWRIGDAAFTSVPQVVIEQGRAADLIVVGAYGHSRIREMVLGGVTRTLLKQMTVPVLMSH